MAVTGFVWSDDREKAIYQQVVKECLKEGHLQEMLARRPEVSVEHVAEAVGSAPYVDRVLADRERSRGHLLYRRVLRISAPVSWAMPVSATLGEQWKQENAARWAGGIVSFTMGVLLALGPAWPLGLGLLILQFLFYAALTYLDGRLSGPFSLSPQTGGPLVTWRHACLLALLNPVTAALWWAQRLTQWLWMSELRRSGLAVEVGRAVEELFGDDLHTLLMPSSYEGLRAPQDDQYHVDNTALVELKRKMAHLDGGTVAVSGPRGVGKTTLMQRCVQPRDFSVFAHAPATYTPHDFLISLFVSVCRTYIDRAGYTAPDFVRLSYLRRLLDRMLPPLRRLLHTLARTVLALALIGFGLYAWGHSRVEELGPRVRHILASAAEAVESFLEDVAAGRAPGAALVLAFAGVFVWQRRLSRSLILRLKIAAVSIVMLCVIAAFFWSVLSLFVDPDLRGREHPGSFRPWQAGLVLAWIGCLYLYLSPPPPGESADAGRFANKQRWFGPPVRLLPFAFVGLTFLDPATRPFLADDENPLRLGTFLLALLVWQLMNQSQRLLPRTAPPMVIACRNHLYRLQTIQSSTAGLTTGVAPFLTLGTTHSGALTSLAPAYPSLVNEFRELLTRIARDEHAQGHRVVIVIDEVDRLGTDVQALSFLAEIKAILGVPHVHYLISVAEDVGAAFVRRGLPHRDVTDSSLDDVLHVLPRTLDESAVILKRRAPDISDPYIAFAHALSGGIPRDLIRYGRRLMEIRSDTDRVQLSELVQALLIEELSETLAGFRTLLAKQEWQPGATDVLDSFRILAAHLRVACPCPEPTDQLRGVLQYFVACGGTGLPDASRRLVDEATAYAYFSLTLLEVFGQPDFTDRRTRAARRLNGHLGLLAEARQELAVSPYSARTVVDAVRGAWQLEPVAAQGTQPDVVIPAPRGAACSAEHATR
ncbi:P-loop NTPase fold protein (plasmid) [Streptomyces laculatispora]|uniref:P-loop NTPase fold protein n=1 Tax=Streptomyces laculatispora TaxID=887464 RepID=A0ABY9IFA7_9ACTN|nr:P-loop NTPase fold protein [Streptomyces laculatispora]WLQ45635.1 P-loop NTPase fold protein [Streptomyces laculatispora]